MGIDIANYLLWTKTASWSMPSFLNRYTLHDSQFLEFRTIPRLGILVLIDWDLSWNPAVPEQHGLLAITFMAPYYSRWVQGAWHQTTLSGARSSQVPIAEREQMVNASVIDLEAFQMDAKSGSSEIRPYMLDDGLTRTVFECMNWGYFEVLHGEQVSFVCFDGRGNGVSVPQSSS